MFKEILLITVIFIMAVFIGLSSQGVDVVSLATDTGSSIYSKYIQPVTGFVQKNPISLPLIGGGITLLVGFINQWRQTSAARKEAQRLTNSITSQNLTLSSKDIEIRTLEEKIQKFETDPSAITASKLREVLLDNKDLSTQLDIRSNRITTLEKRISELQAKVTELELDKRSLERDLERAQKVA